jgi:hypothetical protein
VPGSAAGEGVSGSVRLPWRRRFSAGAAIVFLVGALVTFVAAIVHSGVWRWIVAGAAIVLMVAALWTALTRGGIVRLVSALVVVASLAAVLAVVLSAHPLWLPGTHWGGTDERCAPGRPTTPMRLAPGSRCCS